MHRIKQHWKNQRGAIMVESLIVYMVTICLLFFILAVFSVLFQRWNLQTIANDTASRVAQMYRYMSYDEDRLDLFSGHTDVAYTAAQNRELKDQNQKSQCFDLDVFQYMLNKDGLSDDAEEKAEEYARVRLANSTFTKEVREPEFTLKTVEDTLGRRHVEVQISGEYAVPFGKMLSYVGFNSTTTYTVTAYADCLDLADYINSVDYVNSVSGLGFLKSDTIKAVDSLLKFIQGFLPSSEKNG